MVSKLFSYLMTSIVDIGIPLYRVFCPEREHDWDNKPTCNTVSKVIFLARLCCVSPQCSRRG